MWGAATWVQALQRERGRAVAAQTHSTASLLPPTHIPPYSSHLKGSARRRQLCRCKHGCCCRERVAVLADHVETRKVGVVPPVLPPAGALGLLRRQRRARRVGKDHGADALCKVGRHIRPRHAIGQRCSQSFSPAGCGGVSSAEACGAVPGRLLRHPLSTSWEPWVPTRRQPRMLLTSNTRELAVAVAATKERMIGNGSCDRCTQRRGKGKGGDMEAERARGSVQHPQPAQQHPPPVPAPTGAAPRLPRTCTGPSTRWSAAWVRCDRSYFAARSHPPTCGAAVSEGQTGAASPPPPLQHDTAMAASMLTVRRWCSFMPSSRGSRGASRG